MSDLTQPTALDHLNASQVRAVLHSQGPQLVVAGAGTGKTTVITRRIAHLVASKQCAAREILALTFTEKAASEMENRVDILVPYGFTDSTLCTFHAFGDRILREQGVLLGLSPNYRILSKTDQLIFLREHLFDLPFQKFRPLSDPTRNLEWLLGVFSRAKDEDVTADAYLAFARQRAESLDLNSSIESAYWEKQLELAEIFYKYQELLRSKNLVDFGDLITLALELFRKHPDVLEQYRRQYRYLLVDEFQDTNAAQFELIRLLAGEAGNLTVVGDDDQSIYKFRGAAISNILQFTHYYPQAVITVLTENYRSSQEILDAAYRLIRHNDPERLEVKHGFSKRLISRKENPDSKDTVRLHHFETVSAEADWVADTLLLQRQSRGGSFADFAVLVRTNRQADPFLRALNLKGIPYRFSGHQNLFQRPEVRLCLAFLRSVADPSSPLAFHELAASDVYALPAEDLAACAALSRRRHAPMREILRQTLAEESGGMTPEGRERGGRLLRELGHYVELSRTLSSGQLLYRFLVETGHLKRLTEANNESSDAEIQNLARFFQVVRRYEQLVPSGRVVHFVQHLDLIQELGEDSQPSDAEDLQADAVSVLTVHRSKGLEFPVVFLVGMATQKFPPLKRQPAVGLPDELAKELLPSGDPFLEEERRLCYVAMTRARDRLFLTYARDYGGARSLKISPFLLEALELPPAAMPKSEKVSALEKIHAQAQHPQPLQSRAVPGGGTDLLTLSFNQVDDYLTCPLKYKYAHVLKIPVLPYHAIVYGNALHAAVYEFYRQKMNHLPLDKESILRTFQHAWVNEGFISPEHEELRLQAGISAITTFVEKNDPILLFPKYIEMPFSFTLGKTKVIGRMDRVDLDEQGRATIVDFKSSEVRDSKEAERKARESLQLQIYAAAWIRMGNPIPERMELYFLDTGIVGSVTPEPDKIVAAEETIERVAGEIQRQAWEATPGAWTCGYCAYRTICPHTAA